MSELKIGTMLGSIKFHSKILLLNTWQIQILQIWSSEAGILQIKPKSLPLQDYWSAENVTLLHTHKKKKIPFEFKSLSIRRLKIIRAFLVRNPNFEMPTHIRSICNLEMRRENIKTYQKRVSYTEKCRICLLLIWIDRGDRRQTWATLRQTQSLNPKLWST